MSTQLTIRSALPQEYSRVAALLNELYASEGAVSTLTVADITAMLTSTSPVMQVALACEDTHVVGAIVYYDGFDVQSMTRGVHVADMVVSSASRRTGIGRMLLRYVAAHSRAASGAWMSLTCLKENMAGNKFYQALGFQMISVQFYAIGASGMEALLNQD